MSAVVTCNKPGWFWEKVSWKQSNKTTSVHISIYIIQEYVSISIYRYRYTVTHIGCHMPIYSIKEYKYGCNIENIATSLHQAEELETHLLLYNFYHQLRKIAWMHASTDLGTHQQRKFQNLLQKNMKMVIVHVPKCKNGSNYEGV